jgi:proline-rich protein PRCC
MTISSAPKVDTFVPPEPTPTDEYPGYYKLPSGDWAAHDPTYYKGYYDRWKREYDAHVRALEKGMRGFEGYDEGGAQEVDAQAVMEKAKVEVKEREEQKALTRGTAGEPEKPKMNIQVCNSVNACACTTPRILTCFHCVGSQIGWCGSVSPSAYDITGGGIQQSGGSGGAYCTGETQSQGGRAEVW